MFKMNNLKIYNKNKSIDEYDELKLNFDQSCDEFKDNEIERLDLSAISVDNTTETFDEFIINTARSDDDLLFHYLINRQVENGLISRNVLLDDMNHYFNNNSSSDSKYKVILIQSISGQGKTQLSQQYIDEFKSNYNHIYYISAESEISIYMSYLVIAYKLRIKLSSYNYLDIFNEIINKLNDITISSPVLFVFDNCYDYITVFNEFNMYRNNRCIHIIFTININQFNSPVAKSIISNSISNSISSSVNNSPTSNLIKEFSYKNISNSLSTGWTSNIVNDIYTITLDIFEIYDYANYLSKYHISYTTSDLMKLCKLYNFLSLTMSLSIKYMYNNQIGIPEYLSKYTETKNLILSYDLSHDLPTDLFNDLRKNLYIQTIFISVSISLDILFQKYPQSLLNLLKIFVFLNVDYIPTNVFNMINDSDQKIRDMLIDLNNYSIIYYNENDKCVYIHKLIQKSLLIKFFIDYNAIESYLNVIELTNKYIELYQHVDYNVDDDQNSQLDQEFDVLLDNEIDNDIENNIDISMETIPIDKIITYYPTIHHCNSLLSFYNNISKYKSIYTYTLKVLIDHEISKIFKYIGVFYYDIHRYEESIEYYQKCLVILIKIDHGNSDIFHLRKTISDIYIKLERYNEAISNYNLGIHTYKLHNGYYSTDIAALLNEIGNIYKLMSKFKEALRHYLEALSIYNKIHGYEHIDVADTLSNIATIYNTDRYNDAIDRNMKALDIYTQLLGYNSIKVSNSLNNLAHIYTKIGKYTDGLNKYIEVLNIRKSIYGLYNSNIPVCLNNLATVYLHLHQYNKSLECFKQALDIKIKVYGRKNIHVSHSLHSLGNLYIKLGRYKDGLKKHNENLILRKRLYKSNQLELAKTLQSLGLCLFGLGNYSEALIKYIETKQIKQLIYGSEHVYMATSYNNIGSVYIKLHKFNDALEYCLRALNILNNNINNRSSSINESKAKVKLLDKAMILSNIGLIYENLKDYVIALLYYEQALEIRKDKLDLTHPDIAHNLNNIGAVNYYLNRYDLAIDNYTQALNLRIQRFQKNHLSVVKSYNYIGQVNLSMKLYNEAKSYYLNSYEIMINLNHKNHPLYLSIINHLAYIHDCMDDYSKAIDKYIETINIEKNNKTHHIKISCNYNNLGRLYYKIGKCDDAMNNLEKSVYIKVYNNIYDNSLSISYTNIGNVYNFIGDYYHALFYYIKSFHIKLNFYKTMFTMDIAQSVMNIGLIYKKLNNFLLALDKYKQAELIYDSISDYVVNSMINVISDSYCNSFIIHEVISDIITRIENDCTEKYFRDYFKGSNNQVSVSESGIIDDTVEDINETISTIVNGIITQIECDKSIEIARVHKVIVHKQLSDSAIQVCISNNYNNIAGVYYNMKEYLLALEYSERVLSIRSKLYYKQIDDLNLTKILSNKTISKNINCNSDHIDKYVEISNSYNNLGVLYYYLNDYDESIKCFNIVSYIHKAVYKLDKHPVVLQMNKYLCMINKNQKPCFCFI